jgi:hypothetical protein
MDGRQRYQKQQELLKKTDKKNGDEWGSNKKRANKSTNNPPRFASTQEM